MFDLSNLLIPILIIVVLLLLVISITVMWKRVPQDKALVVTGLKKRVISGGGGFVIPLLERSDRISLENMTIDVDIQNALTSQGVGINVDGVAVVKVKSDETSILAAMEQFNAGTEDRTYSTIGETAKNVLEGKLREIISKMTVEETYKDRNVFASHVSELASTELMSMGLEIKTFTIRDISDRNGYLEALGKPRIAAVRRDAQIAEAEAAKETQIKTSEAKRAGEAARLLAETQIAEAMRDKELKIQEYNKDQETAKATADLAYSIQQNKVNKEVTETQMQVEITKKEKEIELSEKEAQRKERELEATVKKQADASKYNKEKEAEASNYTQVQNAEAESKAIRMKAEAEAAATRVKGQAEADAIKAKGLAEAEAMQKKAEAYQQYNDAAMANMIIEKLPEIAKAVADPLSKTEKIVIVDSGNGQGGGASKVPGYVTDIMAKLPASLEALTGIDMIDMLKKKSESKKLPPVTKSDSDLDIE